MLFIKKIIVSGLFLLFILLSAFVVTSSAATLTWTGGGANNLASNAANWSGNIIPHYGDRVVFDATSTKDCTWDINETIASFSITPAYTGTVTNNAILKVAAITTAAPSATTDPESTTNGSTATLNATVNPNGAETSVYFEWGTSTAYGNTTPAQTISAGTSNIAVTANITGLSINTTYHYRVVAVNSAGTPTGADVAFTTSPIAVTITSPSDGSIISRPDVMVKGTITTSGVNETGVTVNGIVGMVYNNQFVVNHVPLTDGANTISVTATDTAGNTAMTAITVTAVTSSTYIRLNANPESGIAPLDTTMKVAGSFSVISPVISVTGPAAVEALAGSKPGEYLFRMTAEGIYYFTAEATGPDSIAYQDTIAIVVQNATNLDGKFKNIWNSMKAKLTNQDAGGATGYYSFASKDKYLSIFSELAGHLPEIAANMQDISLNYIGSDTAEYRIIRNELVNGQPTEVVYYIYFMKDDDGLWKIQGF